MPDLVISRPIRSNLIVYRGDTGSFTLSVVDPDGEPIDLTSAIWLGQIRSKPDQTVIATLDIALNPTDPNPSAPSSVMVTLSESQSKLIEANATWDVQMSLGGSVVTLIAGAVILTKDVSK